MTPEAPAPPAWRDLPELRGRTAVFRSRRDAGERLAGLLGPLRGASALILAIPAGGVPVGAAMARELALPVHAFPVSKITPPFHSEVGYGAVALDGTALLDEARAEALGVTPEEQRRGIARTREKVRRREELFARRAPLPDLSGRTVVLVDDGLASGATMRVAIRAARRLGASRVVVASPTAPSATLRALRAEADEIVCANVRGDGVFAVADAYERWRDVTEEEAAAILMNVDHDAAPRRA